MIRKEIKLRQYSQHQYSLTLPIKIVRQMGLEKGTSLIVDYDDLTGALRIWRDCG